MKRKTARAIFLMSPALALGIALAVCVPLGLGLWPRLGIYLGLVGAAALRYALSKRTQDPDPEAHRS